MVDNDGVATEFSGGGDPARVAELLWGLRERPRRGPKPRLTVEAVTGAAIAIADAEGIAALSMRRVAERLGVGVMSLYTYVPGKAELIDLMLDAVNAETARDGEGTADGRATGDAEVVSGSGGEGGSGGWRERLERVARDNWSLYRRHPWMLQVATVRPVLGPNTVGKYDRELRAVEGVGLTDVEMDAVLTLVLGHVAGAARMLAEAGEARERSGVTDQEWWEANAPLLQKVFDAERYPVAARVGAAAGAAHQAASSPQHAFEFGLRRVLDGVEVLVRSRADGT